MERLFSVFFSGTIEAEVGKYSFFLVQHIIFDGFYFLFEH